MADHYYTHNPDVKSDESKWTFRLLGKELTFFSDSGVFSKKAVDFGSRVLIEAFEAPAVTGDILDVGCGYGPIGLALASAHPERTVHMVDVNERALALARRNAEVNRIPNVAVYASDTYTGVDERARFAAIVSNPPIRAGKEVVHRILADAAHFLLPGGTLTIVIQKKQGAPSAEKKMQEVFGNVRTVTKEKGYWILESRKD